MAFFNVISKRSTEEIILSRKKSKFCKVANWIIVDILKYFCKPYVITGKLLESH